MSPWWIVPSIIIQHSSLSLIFPDLKSTLSKHHFLLVTMCLEYHQLLVTLGLWVLEGWDLTSATVGKRGDTWVAGTTTAPGASSLRCCHISWSLWSWALPALLLWFHCLHQVQSTHLQMYIHMDFTGILVCCAKHPLLAYGCPTGYNLKGKDKRDDSHCHHADV